MVKKSKLNFGTDYLPIVLAIKILIEFKNKINRVSPSRNSDDYLSFHTVFLDIPEYDVIDALASFVNADLIQEIRATLYKAEDAIERYKVETYTWTKDNLDNHHMPDFIQHIIFF